MDIKELTRSNSGQRDRVRRRVLSLGGLTLVVVPSATPATAVTATSVTPVGPNPAA